MFPSTRRTIAILFRTPLVPVSSAPPALELTTMTRAGPSRPRAATRTYSNMSFRSVAQVEAYGNGNSMSRRGYASDHGKKELYSDEAGSSGAGTDDVAHSDAAFNKDPNPESAAKDIEKETGKDYTKRSPANASSSEPMNQQGKPGTVDNPKLTSNSEAKKH